MFSTGSAVRRGRWWEESSINISTVGINIQTIRRAVLSCAGWWAVGNNTQGRHLPSTTSVRGVRQSTSKMKVMASVGYHHQTEGSNILDQISIRETKAVEADSWHKNVNEISSAVDRLECWILIIISHFNDAFSALCTVGCVVVDVECSVFSRLYKPRSLVITTSVSQTANKDTEEGNSPTNRKYLILERFKRNWKNPKTCLISFQRGF